MLGVVTSHHVHLQLLVVNQFKQFWYLQVNIEKKLIMLILVAPVVFVRGGEKLQ